MFTASNPWIATAPESMSSVARSARAQRAQHRREVIWAWLSLAILALCWDLSARLDERVSPPRVRLTHVVEKEVKVDGIERSIEL
jgi:hypothetical protein